MRWSTIHGLDTPVGPGSTIAAVAIVNCIKVRTAQLLIERGAMPPVLTRASVVGAERSRELFERPIVSMRAGLPRHRSGGMMATGITRRRWARSIGSSGSPARRGRSRFTTRPSRRVARQGGERMIKGSNRSRSLAGLAAVGVMATACSSGGARPRRAARRRRLPRARRARRAPAASSAKLHDRLFERRRRRQRLP